MAITKSAKKALRSSKRKQLFNARKKDQVYKTVKKFKKLVADKKVSEAEKMFPNVQKVLDKAAKTGFIKKNTAGRKKARLSKMIAKGK